MIIYILVAVFLLLGGVGKTAKIIFPIGFFGLFFLTAFRDPVLAGHDYYVYSNYFSVTPSLLSDMDIKAGYFEAGFNFLNAFVKVFSNEYVVFQVAYSILIFILMWSVIKKLCLSDEQKCLFLFSFFCFHFIWDTWVILRQNIADWLFWLLLICFYRCSASEKIKKGLFILGALFIPVLFHSTAKLNILLMPMMLLVGRISPAKRLIGVPLISVLLFMFGDQIYDLAHSLVLPYMRVDMANYGMVNSNFINFFVRLGLFILFAWHYESEKNINKKIILDTFTMMILIGSFNNVATTRLYEYYAIGLYSSMALLLNSFNKRSQVFIYFGYGLVMIFILARFVMTFDNGQAFMNYSLFWG